MRLSQQFDPAHEKEFFELEAQFQKLEEKYKDFPKGKRMSPIAAEEPCNTLIWECEFDSIQKAYEALDFFKNNDEHEKLFEKQKHYIKNVKIKFYRNLVF